MEDYTILNKVDDNILKEMIALDNLVFKDKDIGNFDRCKEWLSANLTFTLYYYVMAK